MTLTDCTAVFVLIMLQGCVANVMDCKSVFELIMLQDQQRHEL